MLTVPSVEELAQALHESGREAVEGHLVVNDLGKPFLGWYEISEEAREGRRVMARWVLERFEIHYQLCKHVSSEGKMFWHTRAMPCPKGD